MKFVLERDDGEFYGTSLPMLFTALVAVTLP
jgi:hypothetical protein